MVEFKHTRLNHTVLHLNDSDIKHFDENYNSKAKTAPKFFHNANILLDTSALNRPLSLEHIHSIKATIDLSGAKLIGVINVNQEQQKLFDQAYIPNIDTRKEAPVQSENINHTQGILIKKVVRSGMQVYARKQNLIIQGNVGRGAEVIADGHIICLGKLNGKVIAGASGDNNSQIMAANFKPELVSIAGIYALNDDIDQNYFDTGTCVSLQNNILQYASYSTNTLVHG